MTSLRIPICAFVTALLLAVSNSSAWGQTIAGDDFDSGANNGGFTAATTALFEGDFDSATSSSHDNTFNGLFDFGAGSRFDRFGKVNATVMDGASFAGSQEGLPFDMVDDSAGSFTIDRLGVLTGGVNNGAFGLADTLNGANVDETGLVSAAWTFDISAGSNMQISVDFAAIGAFDNNDGAFETDDFMTFSYSIDGGATHTAFDVRPEGSPGGAVTNGFYTVNMDGGVEYDRYFIPSAFFSVPNWEQLTTSGPFGAVTFHPDDTDMDGLVELEGEFGVESTRAFTSGDFDNTELEIFKNPLIVNGDATTGTILDNKLQTVTVPIEGSGETLTLKLLAVADGGLEYSFFDNILIEEVAAGGAGDFDGSGSVGNGDLTLLLDNWGNTVPPTPAGWVADVPTEPAVGNDELTRLLDNWGNSTVLQAAAVPEPATIGLISLAMVLISAQRNGRRA